MTVLVEYIGDTHDGVRRCHVRGEALSNKMYDERRLHHLPRGRRLGERPVQGRRRAGRRSRSASTPISTSSSGPTRPHVDHDLDDQAGGHGRLRHDRSRGDGIVQGRRARSSGSPTMASPTRRATPSLMSQDIVDQVEKYKQKILDGNIVPSRPNPTKSLRGRGLSTPGWMTVQGRGRDRPAPRRHGAHLQTVPWGVGQRRRLPRDPSRRGPRADRRERCGQVHADADPLRDVPADRGRITVRGEEAKIASPRDAIALGIGMVHQHFVLVDPFTVAENIILGMEGGRDARTWRASEAQGRRARRRRTASPSIPRAVVEDLSVGEEQRVEILKALYRGVEFLILDEPTAVLTPAGGPGTVREPPDRLRDDGKTIVFISHKLDEVLEIADRITVLRRGAVVGETTPAETTKAKLAEMMVGRPVLFRLDKPAGRAGRARPEGGRCSERRGRCTALSLEVRRGEIVGVAGVEGNGQRELADAIMGLRPVDEWPDRARRPRHLARAHHRGDPQRRRRRSSPRTGMSRASCST